MNKTTIYVKATGPIFMVGAETKLKAATSNGKEREELIPELRAAGIKGNMRFIWRAIQCAGDVDRLREDEGQLFGNAGVGNPKQSDLRIRVQNVRLDVKEREVMTPHRNLPEYDGKGRAFPAQALKSGGTFEVVIVSFGAADTHLDFVRLFVLTSLLYGFGRRSRKGFGTAAVTKIEGIGSDLDCTFDGAAAHLNKLSGFGAKYSQQNSTIINVQVQRPANYPYIKRIWVGKRNFPDTVKIAGQIGMAAHHHTGGVFLGTSNPRFASSVLLSAIPWGNDSFRNSFRCIITELNCTQNFNRVKRESFYQELDGRI